MTGVKRLKGGFRGLGFRVTGVKRLGFRALEVRV